MTQHNPSAFTLPPVKRDELHDDIALALDALSCQAPLSMNIVEARGYLRHALRVIGGAA